MSQSQIQGDGIIYSLGIAIVYVNYAVMAQATMQSRELSSVQAGKLIVHIGLLHLIFIH